MVEYNNHIVAVNKINLQWHNNNIIRYNIIQIQIVCMISLSTSVTFPTNKSTANFYRWVHNNIVPMTKSLLIFFPASSGLIRV